MPTAVQLGFWCWHCLQMFIIQAGPALEASLFKWDGEVFGNWFKNVHITPYFNSGSQSPQGTYLELGVVNIINLWVQTKCCFTLSLSRFVSWLLSYSLLIISSNKYIFSQYFDKKKHHNYKVNILSRKSSTKSKEREKRKRTKMVAQQKIYRVDCVT